jgi:hypothetical protein
VSGNVRIGQCKLTGAHGRYVKSHIIPEALTETVWKDQPLTQIGRNGKRIKRWTSWYDSRLVTAEGEAILADYDDWAINFFRQKKLIWSSWGPMEQLELPDHTWSPDRNRGFRKLEGVDCTRLRLFFLSLLWRAAATSLFEFDLVSITANELAQLREMVLHGQVEPYHFFPVTLIQLSTRNFPHNQAVSRLIKREPIPDPITGKLLEDSCREIQYYRFYFDGLVAHMHINDDAEHVAGGGAVYVEPGNELWVMTLPSEGTAHFKRFWHGHGGPPPPFVTRRSHLS